MKSAQVSVIIPCYNGATYLAAAIASVDAQTYPATEIIVVDDGSTDDTRAVCQRYPQVHYHHQPNQGVSAARNAGIQASQGDCLVFLDCDDRLLPEALAIGVRELHARPEVAMVFGHYLPIDEQGQPLPRGPLLPPVATYESLLDCQHLIPPAGAMTRRSILSAIGGFDIALRRGEDYDLWLRLAQTYPIHYHQQPVFEYRRHPGNASAQAADMLCSALQVLNRQWSDIRQRPSAVAAYGRGRQFWLNLLGPSLVYQLLAALKHRRWLSALSVLRVLLRHYPQGLSQLLAEGWRKLVRQKPLPN